MRFVVGETPLHSACIKGDQTTVEALLEQGADINSVDNAGNHAIIIVTILQYILLFKYFSGT